ncbi:MAG TPA: hypothetical protein VNU72_07805 [Puia sp.]|nr:hypothetical protein [Puia sp.]
MIESNEKKDPKKVKRQISGEAHEKFLKDINRLPDTNTQIAAAMGIDVPLVSNYKSGVKWPGSATVKKFYSVFGAKLDALDKNNKPDQQRDERDHQKELKGQTIEDDLKKYDPPTLASIDQRTQQVETDIKHLNIKVDKILEILQTHLSPDRGASGEPEKK